MLGHEGKNTTLKYYIELLTSKNVKVVNAYIDYECASQLCIKYCLKVRN